MTTNSISYQNEFFHFDPEKIVTTTSRRVVNPRSTTSLRIKISSDKTKGELNRILTSNYDIEIYPASDIADVFCNIKTKMIWDFQIEKSQELGSLQFSEGLLHHTLNQIHFATTLLRQNFIMDFATTAGLLHKPKVFNIHKQMKEQLTFLADLNLNDDYPFLFSYWY